MDSSLTQVTVGRSAEISPIPNALGSQSNHLIYTSTARSHNPGSVYESATGGISSTLRFSSDSSLTGVQIQSNRSVLSSTSSVYQQGIEGITDGGSISSINDSGNHLHIPSTRGYHHNDNHHTTANNNGRLLNSNLVSGSFAMNHNSGASSGTNLLMTSANNFLN